MFASRKRIAELEARVNVLQTQLDTAIAALVTTNTLLNQHINATSISVGMMAQNINDLVAASIDVPKGVEGTE